jgi:aspartyl-tRNA(Asn)/glutamyl-tRNA(Gln) amidotransferase subunit A
LYQHRSIAAFHEQLAQGLISCEQVVRHYLQRIDASRHLNAFVDVYADEALALARKLDQKLAAGEPMGRLFGVVVGIKDVICYQGHTVTAGSKMLRGFHTLYSATAVERLLAEDAIIIGNLNCDEFAMGSSNENSAYGKVLNARDESRVPGGSSGGSAVAVQAGLCMVSLGSDTGGSVRQPADFCGILGLKPSYGRISRYGLIAYASSFDQIGILGTDVGDLAMVLEVMAGADDYDSTASPEPVPPYAAQLHTNRKFRIAYFRQALEHPALDPHIADGIRAFMDALQADGHTVQAVDVGFLDHIVPTYYVLTTAEASSNLGRYDGIRYGYRSDKTPADLDNFYKLNRSEGFGKEVKRRIMLGTFVLSAGYYDAYFTKAQQVRRQIFNDTQQIFKDFDIILSPVSPTTAFRFGEKSQDAISMFLADVFTVYANLAGIPGISFPLGTHPNGMPFGVQAMTNRMEELSLLQFTSLSYLRYAMMNS